ncbi:MAG: Gldg family protein [Chloroflexi bacterium]|nr:Gldg family protein [Chloroflexota bacterium]
MRQSEGKNFGSAMEPRAREQTGVRTVLLAVVCFLLGLGLGAYWLYRSTGRSAVTVNGGAAGQQPSVLSESAKALLQRLDSPIEIRFYALLDPASVSDSLPAFAGRVDQLLSEYRRKASGKIKVSRYNSQSDSSANAASADGIQPFNLDKGDACYLGIAVVHKGQKEPLPQLSPEWEQALPSDLSRAIVRLINASAPTRPATATAQIDPATTEAVKHMIPNFASVSVEGGTRILREAALREFKAAANEMEIQVKEAQQQLSRAQNGGSDAEQQAAMKNLQQVQAEQTEKLRQIAARSQAQIEALQQLKGAAR